MRKITALVLFVLAVSAAACSHQSVELADGIVSVPSESSAVEDRTPLTEEAIIDAIKEEPVAEAKKYDEEGTGAAALSNVIAEVPTSEPEEVAVEKATPEALPEQADAPASGDVSATGLPSSQVPTQVSQPTPGQWTTQLGASMTSQEHLQYQALTNVNYSTDYYATQPPSRGPKRIIDCEHTRIGCP